MARMDDKTAAPYSEQVAARRAATQKIKGKGRPLGGAPPIPEGKMAEHAAVEDDHAAPHAPPIPGVGAAYDINQAVARSGAGGPVSLSQAKEIAKQGKMSQSSIEAMEAIKRDIEMGNRDVSEERPSEPSEADQLEDAEREMTGRDLSFDFEGVAESRNRLANEKKRELIESRLEPMDIGDLVSESNEISQTVPVVEGKLSLTFRTYSHIEYMHCLRYVADHDHVSPMYVEELANICKVCCALVAINGVAFPEHRERAGQRDEAVNDEKFNDKLSRLMRLPVHLTGEISVQAMWFNDRVTKLFSFENLKNG